jgi:hypothetical protein
MLFRLWAGTRLIGTRAAAALQLGALHRIRAELDSAGVGAVGALVVAAAAQQLGVRDVEGW